VDGSLNEKKQGSELRGSEYFPEHFEHLVVLVPQLLYELLLIHDAPGAPQHLPPLGCNGRRPLLEEVVVLLYDLFAGGLDLGPPGVRGSVGNAEEVGGVDC